jgi:hypothetical protein
MTFAHLFPTYIPKLAPFLALLALLALIFFAFFLNSQYPPPFTQNPG